MKSWANVCWEATSRLLFKMFWRASSFAAGSAHLWLGGTATHAFPEMPLQHGREREPAVRRSRKRPADRGVSGYRHVLRCQVSIVICSFAPAQFFLTLITFLFSGFFGFHFFEIMINSITCETVWTNVINCSLLFSTVNSVSWNGARPKSYLWRSTAMLSSPTEGLSTASVERQMTSEYVCVYWVGVRP